MNWLCTIFQLTYCLHYVVFASHLKHFRTNNNNNNNKNFDNFWFNRVSNENSVKNLKQHRIKEHDIWNNYQSYQPSMEESLAVSRYEISTERPPYYLSYDSGIKTRYQVMEEKLIQQQMTDKRDQDYESNTRTKFRFELPSKQLSHDDYRIQIQSQIKEQEENQKHNHNNHTSNIRRVGAKGLGGTFGFMEGQHFFPCDKPKFLKNDPETGYYQIPESLGYYKKCQYYNEDPRRQFQRKVGPLGKDGFYGYFHEGIFIECAPPTRLEQDTQDPNLYYIPNDIEYEPRCQYYDYNVSKRFDASTDTRSGFGGSPAITLNQYWLILLPFYLSILIILSRF